MTMMLVGLSFFHSVLFIQNRTTLDQMKGNEVGIPCVSGFYSTLRLRTAFNDQLSLIYTNFTLPYAPLLNASTSMSSTRDRSPTSRSSSRATDTCFGSRSRTSPITTVTQPNIKNKLREGEGTFAIAFHPHRNTYSKLKSRAEGSNRHPIAERKPGGVLIRSL